MPHAILLLGLLGHFILWVAIVNRLHGLGIDRHWVDLLTAFCALMLPLLPVGVVLVLADQVPGSQQFAVWLRYAAWGYAIGCSAVALVAAVLRLYWRFHPERRGVGEAVHVKTIDLAKEAEPLLAPGIAQLIGRLPLNEVLKLSVQKKQLLVPGQLRRPLSIIHLSDLHMSGRVTRPFFERVVDEVNTHEVDLIAITGDIVEYPACLDWIPATLGRLRSKYGVYYVLGNHDRRVGMDRLNEALANAGLIHVGRKCCSLNMDGMDIVLCGSELPWFGPPAEPARSPSAREAVFRIALVHSPDQFRWARARGVELVLAGHVHGGQVCVPLLGPIVAPSLHGVRYAAGVYKRGNTVMHVSRGTSSFTPIRWNCAPEIAILEVSSSTLNPPVPTASV